MNILQDLTAHLVKGCALSAAEVSAAMTALLTPEIADAAKAEFLTALAVKGETAEEIAAFARELRSHAVDPIFNTAKLLDIVGTGADGANTFNISSCTMFVAAAAGIAVAKHGNRAITSKCGSADVLECLGVRIEMSPAVARQCLAETGVAFLFAPLYHPAFKIIEEVETPSDLATYEKIEKSLTRVLRRFSDIQETVPLGQKWTGGRMVLYPGDKSLKEKEIPVETFFHKIVMVRDRVRVMEQRINASNLTDEEKVDLEQYITRIYGSLTTFNVLFKNKEDQFTGEKLTK